MTKRLTFDERSEKQHRNKMSHLLTRIRKDCNFSENDYDDITLYCKGVEGMSNTGDVYMKRVANAAFKKAKTEQQSDKI